MKRRRLPLLNYLLGFSLALLIVSTCFRAQSNSSPSSPAALNATGIETTVASPSGAVLTNHVSAFAPLAIPFAPAITATKVHAPAGSASPGDTLTYTVTITNSGSDAFGVNFSDTIDPNTTYVGGSLSASPIASDDSYHTIGNVHISVPAGQGVIANDTNPNGAGTLTVTKVNATGVPGGGSATASTANGSVNMSSDGSFVYTPNAAFRGPSDSFTYTLDNGTGKTDTATVTIAVNGLIWFVDSGAAINGDGRLSSPFKCLVGSGCYSSAASIANDNIFVYSGSYTGGLTLLAGQKLIGQGAGDTLLNITGLTAPSGTNLLPSTGGANPTIAASGDDITLASGNTIRGVTLNGTAMAAVDLSGTGFGTVIIAETSLGGTGQALDLSNGTLSGPVAATAAFTSISSNISSTTGISLSSVAGAMSSGSTTIDRATGAGISVATSSAALNFGTTSSTLSGGAGISLTTNTGTITFGAVTVAPNAGQEGLVATDNSNTITMASGSVSTSGAAAVDITRAVGTTPLAISLTSVSANGGANGIKLTNTSGSFTVTGDGSNNGSGGTIQSSTVDGVALTNAQNISLTSMSIQGSAHNGINGTQVNNFSFTFGTINNTGATSRDSNIAFNTNPATANNLSGTLTVTNSTLTNAFYSGIDVESGDGTVTNATISNNTITSSTSTSTSQGFGININGTGTTTTVFKLNKATISNNTITNFPTASGIQINGGNGSVTGPGTTVGIPNDASNLVSITGNTIQGNSPINRMGGSAIIVAVQAINPGSRSQANINISNNGTAVSPLTNIAGTVIGVGCNGYTTMTATANNNVIVANHQPNLGGANGIGGGTGPDGAGLASTPILTMTATGNTVSQTDGNGILLVARGAHGTFDLKLANNTVLAPINVGGSARQGIRVDAGNVATGDDAVCLNITNNTSAGSNGAQGIGLRKQGTIAATNDFGLPGLSPSPATAAQAATFAAGNNPTGGGVDIISGANFVSCGTAPLSNPIEVAAAQHATTDAPGADVETDGDSTLVVNKLINLEADRKRLGIEDGRKLSPQELTWMVQAAIERWRDAGASPADLTRLQQVVFAIDSLPDGQLARRSVSGITIDESAGGLGWYYDPTPSDDGEFAVPVLGREVQATEFSPAFGRVDLLTVITRQLGLVYLEGKDRTPKQLRWMMQPLLPTAVRRMPVFNIRPVASVQGAGNRSVVSAAPAQPKNDAAVSPVPAIFTSGTDLTTDRLARIARRTAYAGSARRVAAVTPAMFSGETVTLNIGTIPAGKSVTITFQVKVDNPLPAGVCSVTNTAHITGSNFSQVDTNSDVTNINKPLTLSACPANIVKNTDNGACTAVVTFTSPTGDGCPAPTVTCTPASGTAFSKGVTTVTCTASNGVAADASCTFTVTVNDNQAPQVNCPASFSHSTDPNVCTAVVTYVTPTATDNCPGVGAVACSPASGTAFPKGVNTVTCSVTDASSNSASCSFTVTVNDTQAPTINCPPSIVHDTDPNACSATVTYASPTVSDNCPGVGSPSCSPTSGSSFPQGVTTVTCSVTDASGNTASCSFTVTVRDTQAPTLGACPANISTVSSGGCQVVTYTSPTATDNCGSATVVCSPPSGFCFPAGTTTVTCTASDSSPDSPDSSCSFTVTVVPCTISCPGNITVGTNPSQSCGTTVTFSPSTSAGCGTVSCSPSSGSFFPVGTTSVTCSTQAGPSCSFSVTVFDNTPPSLTCAANQTALAGTGCQAAVPNFVVSAGDNCGSVTVTQTPAAGTLVGPGVYPVHVSVTDSSGNTTTCDKTFTVTNDAPIATSVTGPSGPISLGTSASVTVTYTDTAVQGHNAVFSWGDGSPNTTVSAASPASSGSIAASHTYAATGVYTVTVTVKDDCGAASAPFIYQFIVVYDANGGFVTGGGWIMSAAGSYVANPSATGKANFGFVVKYHNGDTVPSGNTEFKFDSLNFKATAYEWLVISGAKSQFKGSGTINGAGDYRFLVTVTDGDQPGGDGVDKFRIKIWNATTNAVVYDNVMGGSDDINFATPQALGGGSIVIH